MVNEDILYPFLNFFVILFSGLRQLFFLHTNDHMDNSKAIQQSWRSCFDSSLGLPWRAKHSLRRRRRKGLGIGRKGKRKRDWEERVRYTCYKNPHLFISADAGVCKFLIGWAVMSQSNLLAGILACISERQIWWRHQGNVFFWHELWKIQNYSNHVTPEH